MSRVPSDPSEQSWEGGAMEALRLVVLAMWVIGCAGGVSALLDVTFRANAAIAENARVTVGLMCVALGMLVVLGGAARRQHSLTRAVVTPLLLATGMILAVPPMEAVDPVALAWWPSQFVIVAIAFGAWSSTRRGWIPIVALIGVNAALRWSTWHADSLIPELSRLDLVAGQTGQLIAMSVSAFLSVNLALSASRMSDDLAQQARQARADAARQGAAARQSREADRMVHDEILYGLRAVAMGSEIVPPARAVAAIRQALGLVTAAARQPGDEVTATIGGREAVEVESLKAAVTEACAQEGVIVHVLGSERIRIPEAVTVAIAGAVRETVRNVARHASIPEATVTVARVGSEVVVTVRDKGRGFQPHLEDFGKGIQQSVVNRLSDVGGIAKVDSALGEGTTVTLAWSPLGGAPRTRGMLLLTTTPGLVRALILILVPQLASIMWLALWFSGYLPGAVATLAATAVAVLSGGSALWLGQRQPISAWGSAALIMVAWMAALINGLALTHESLSVHFFWMATGASLIGSILSIFRRLREAVLCWVGTTVICAVTSFAAAGSVQRWLTFVPSVAAPIALAAIGILVRRVLDRVAWHLLGAEADIALSATAASGYRALQARLAERLKGTQDTLSEFLTAIIANPALLGDPAVMHRAGLLERAVRDDLVVSGDSSLRAVITTMREAGWAVTVRSDGELDAELAEAALTALRVLPSHVHQDSNGSVQASVTVSASWNDLGRRLGLSIQHHGSEAFGEPLRSQGWLVQDVDGILHCVRRFAGRAVESWDSTLVS
jgi:signal transduction histidine kinase